MSFQQLCLVLMVVLGYLIVKEIIFYFKNKPARIVLVKKRRGKDVS